MKKVKLVQILKTAKKLAKNGKKWHFHILMPGCKFNKDKRFALILENTSDNEQLVHFSLKKPSKSGQKLVEMLHGKGITKGTKKSDESLNGSRLSVKVKLMVKKATELNLKGFTWHHHVLFPDCMFNQDSRYWSLVFENTLDNEVIEERFKEEPKVALSLIEPLFYKK